MIEPDERTGQLPHVVLGPGGDFARPMELGRPWSMRRFRAWLRGRRRRRPDPRESVGRVME